MAEGLARGECVQPIESRRDVRRLWAKWCSVCCLLLRMWWAVSTRRVSRMSRTEGSPAPTPSCDMKRRGDDDDRASFMRALNTEAMSLSMLSSSLSVMGTTSRR